MVKTETREHASASSAPLERAQEPREIANLLRNLEFTEADIAEGTDSDIRSVRRWKSADPGVSSAERLAEIRNLVVRLQESEVLTDRGVVYWMRHPNRLLDDFSPLATVGAGGFRSARDAALCFADTERGFETPLTASVRKKLERGRRGRRKSRHGTKTRELETVA